MEEAQVRSVQHRIVERVRQLYEAGKAHTYFGSVGEEEAEVETYDQGVDMAELSLTLGKLARRMPAMSDSYFRGGWSGLFSITPDWHPILDQVPGVDGLHCAVAFSGHGFNVSPMIGMTMSELITGGRSTSIDISPLRLNRFVEGDLVSSSYRYRVLA